VDDFFKQFLGTQERIAAALEKIVANGGGGFVAGAGAVAEEAKTLAKASTKAEEKEQAKPVEPETPAVPEGPVYTIDEVRAALKEFRAIEGNVAMLEVLKTNGGGKESLPEIDAKHFPAIMEAVGAAK
jgi:hypothetical protein